jgi:hypothetical protein
MSSKTAVSAVLRFEPAVIRSVTAVSGNGLAVEASFVHAPGDVVPAAYSQ